MSESNKMKIPDIDIDTDNRDNILTILQHIPASKITNNKITKHNVGVYFQDIPIEIETGYASIDYKNAEKLGYFKIDFLNNSIYNNIENEEELDKLLNQEPVWEMLEEREIVEQLAHIGNHFDVVKKIKPKSIEELAIALALIRPAKYHLIGKNMDYIKKEIWKKPKEGYYFSKAHSIAYATSIVVQMNKMINE